MRRHPKYRIRIEDESRLENLADISLSPLSLLAAAGAALLILIIIGGAIVMVTPLRTLLPGYMKQSELSATEDNIMRLDSILGIYEQNQNYLDNILLAFDTDRKPIADSLIMTANLREMSPDSLLPPSPLERKFVNTMEERERFNISVLAPLAADGMMFFPVSDSGIFSSASRTEEKGYVIMPDEEAVKCVADGSILASYYSASGSGYVIIIQHAKGFVTRIARVGSPMVSAGDAVTGGQVIALGPSPDAKGKRYVEVMMWHNGLPLIPYEYIGNPESMIIKDAPFEAPRGR